MAETTSLQNERDQILARWYGGARATKISKSRKWEILVKSSLAQRSGDLVESEVGRLAQSGDNVGHDDNEVLGDGLMTSAWPQSEQRRAVVVQLHQTRRLHVRWLCTTHTHTIIASDGPARRVASRSDGLMTSSWPQSQQRRAIVVQLHQTRRLHVRWLCTTHTPASDHIRSNQIRSRFVQHTMSQATEKRFVATTVL